MTNAEFSDSFTTLLNSYGVQEPFGMQSARNIELDEYEKSVFLTMAQDEVFVNLYNGKNPYGESFEHTEELRRYLDELVSTRVYDLSEQVTGREGVSPASVFFALPDDLAFILMEQVKLGSSAGSCALDGYIGVQPVTHDEYNRLHKNPFRGATMFKALRIDSGDNEVEIVSEYRFTKYRLRYLRKPVPIILEDLPDGLSISGSVYESSCELDPLLHQTILNRAVQIAIATKGGNTKDEN